MRMSIVTGFFSSTTFFVRQIISLCGKFWPEQVMGVGAYGSADHG